MLSCDILLLLLFFFQLPRVGAKIFPLRVVENLMARFLKGRPRLY